jgi:exodeoxyribonuclease-5
LGDTLTLCATTRLAQTLRGELPAERSAWPTRPALTVGQWLATLADEAELAGGTELPVALAPYAERILWEKAIAASLDEAAPLFDLPGMAACAAEAHALCRAWNLNPPGMPLSDEAQRFVAWQGEFIRRCRAGGWLDPAGVQRQVVALIEAGHFTLPERIAFAGFDRLTPFEERLIAAVEARGIAVENQPFHAVDRSSARVIPCADNMAECNAVAAWAQARLAANPDCRLGIVAPDLAAVRARIEFALDDLLHPALIRPDGAERPRCFNFSLGRPLADQPLIRTALDLLALASGRIRIEQSRFSALLLADGWGASSAEADGRARLDAAMRRDLPYFTSLAALPRLAERLAGDEPALCPQSLAALAALSDILASPGGRQLPAAWAGAFRRALAAAGWPGDRALSSHEYQSRHTFLEVLEEFARLDPLLGRLTAADAVRRLRELCRQRVFQPETRGRPAIQVLGVLESAGLQFDALWVMGMNDDQWPPAARPNPLLPAELLRACGAAHASAEVELDFARRVHARLLRAAPEVNFSHALADGTRMLRPSPLIAGLPRGEADVPATATLARRLAADCRSAAEVFDDSRAPPVVAGEKVPGGSWLLRAQAICPAWAFYQYRLGAKAMETPVEGLDPRARGTLVHAALEAFWKAVRTSQALAVLDAPGRAQAIAVAVQAALDGFEGERRVALPTRFRTLEAARLQRLLETWMDFEGGRSEAFEVIACEREADVEIEDIRVRMVVDRIDRLDDGRQVIIDYKTGASIDIRNWAGARLTEPQLPIYAALVADDVAAVVFAKVLLDKPAFAGIAGEKNILPGVQGLGDDRQKIFDPAEFPDWTAVVTHWRERLYAIANEVKEGVAGVAIADETALLYCDVLPLLRLPERRRLLAAALAGRAP